LKVGHKNCNRQLLIRFGRRTATCTRTCFFIWSKINGWKNLLINCLLMDLCPRSLGVSILKHQIKINLSYVFETQTPDLQQLLHDHREAKPHWKYQVLHHQKALKANWTPNRYHLMSFLHRLAFGIQKNEVFLNKLY